MADMTQTQLQGYFTSNGKSTTIVLPSGVDWLQIVNQTASANAALGAAAPVQWYWQAGMPAGAGISYWKTSVAADSVNLQQYTTTNGFTFINGYGPQFGIPVDLTTTTGGVNPPVYNTATTTGLVPGSIVRIYGTNEMSVNGYDVQVGTVNAGVSFTAAATWQQDPPASTNGYYQIVNPQDPWYPASRIIVNITQAASAVVTVSVWGGYVIGQEVSFRCPDPIFGMTQIDQMVGTITAINAATLSFTVNINTTAFNGFIFNDFASAVTFPQVVPVGENTSVALAQVPPLSTFSDATLNTAYYGLQFPGGASAAAAGPAGINNDVIYWRAGVSFLNDTTGALIIH